MKALFGVCNDNPANFIDSVRDWVVANGGTKNIGKPRLLGFEATELPNMELGILLVPTVSLLIKWLKQLNASDLVVVVFDTPVLLEYLDPTVEILDLVEKSQSYKYVFQKITVDNIAKVCNTLKTDAHIKVASKTVDLIPTLLNQTKSSMLSHILTYFYSIKDTNRRKELHDKFYLWVKLGKGVDELSSILDTEVKATDKLIAYLKTDISVNTIKAAREMAKLGSGKTIIEKLSTKYNVAVFDLRYLASVFSKQKQ